MPKGYMITVTDPERYAVYARQANILFSAEGAKLIGKPNTCVVLEGRAREKTLVFEFQSADDAKAFYASPGYQAAKLLRDGAAEADFIVFEGLD
jgi:uncharacterized protein (DUF1330 family)